MKWPFSRRKPGFRDHKTIRGKAGATAVLLWRTVTFPFRAAWKAGAFAVTLAGKWWKDRKLIHLVRGIPSILLAAICIYFLIGIKATSNFARGEKYMSAGMAACNAEQWETAKLYLKRAHDLGLGNNQTLFSLARAAEATEDSAMMVAILERLAPDDRPVHPPAHLWKVTQLIAGKHVNRELMENARTHLRHVLTLNPDHAGMHAILGEMYFQEQLWSSAIPHLQKANPAVPKYRLMLAKACLLNGDRIDAERYARQAQQVAERVSVASPENVDERLLWADATTLLEQYEEATRILAEGLKVEQDNPLLRAGLAQVYIHWADSIEGVSDRDNQQKFTLLAESMKHNPDDAMLFDRMLRLMQRQGDAAAEVKAFLLQNIVEGRAVGLSHLMLGTAAWGEEDKQKAAVHLERAFVLFPNAATVANNFAWYLANKDPSEPERALKMIEPVLARTPKNHHIRDTRGHIYLQLGRWADAVDDLEFAAQKLRTNSQTHQGLATAYRQLGLTDLADEHDRAAKILAEQAAPIFYFSHILKSISLHLPESSVKEAYS